jgi:hypothetical protein
MTTFMLNMMTHLLQERQGDFETAIDRRAVQRRSPLAMGPPIDGPFGLRFCHDLPMIYPLVI